MAQCGAITTTPHAGRLAGLPAREQYAAMELWRGTMTAHSAVVYRSDVSTTAVNVSFDGERCLSYVPIRLPWARLVEERLPASAAGVLLNRSHQHHDLILMLTAQDKQLFERIDGHRSIAEIADGTARARARTFFETLWRYDQVVFDASRARTLVR